MPLPERYTPEQLRAMLDDFDWDSYATSLGDDYGTLYQELVLSQGKATARQFGFAFDPGDATLQQTMTAYVGERIKQLTETSKLKTIKTIRAALAKGEETGTTRDLGTLVAEKVREEFAGFERWRADRIARTESGIAYNHGTVLAASQGGFEFVEVADGDDADEFNCACPEKDGQIWPLDYALANPLEHPNCTRVFLPVEKPE